MALIALVKWLLVMTWMIEMVFGGFIGSMLSQSVGDLDEFDVGFPSNIAELIVVN